VKTLLFMLGLILSQGVLANGSPDLLKLNSGRDTVRNGDIKVYQIGAGAYLSRVFMEMKSKAFDNSYVQIIVNGKVVKNIGVTRGSFQSYRAFVGEFAASVAIRVISGKIRVKGFYVEMSDQPFPYPNPVGQHVILPRHGDYDLAYLLEDLRMNLDNFRGFVSIDDWRDLNEISVLAAKVLSIMNVRGDSYDEALLMIRTMLIKMDAAAPLIDSMMERNTVAHLAENFNSIKEALKMLTFK